MPTIILVFAIISVVGGWTTRNARILADPDWTMVLSAFSTEELRHVLQSGFPSAGALPYGISISVGSQGIALWKGRMNPEVILSWRWSEVIGVHASAVRIVTDKHIALVLVVPAPWGTANLTLPLLGSYPFGARPMAPGELDRTMAMLAALRDS
ncbi:hypothetical protein [Herbiconiux ginsengi]|uniref:hypothetical protein n=1 Tax=Herbiconiux ginsengi TaxID=381665 RepID=UPI001114CFAF|nr:hypothetical protein [Herbiconiux ginsengi]